MNTKSTPAHTKPPSKPSSPAGGDCLHRLVERAFRVEVKDWPEATSIVRATSPSKAKYASWNSANEVGYKITFGMLRVRRAPEYDGIRLDLHRAYGEDYVISLNAEGDSQPPTKD